jgi:Domain of unknown function (DUF1772)
MRALDLVTILCAAFMTGNEIAVSLFVNPVVWQLDEPSQAQALRLFAARLGNAMPVWYAASLLLMVIEAILHRHQPAFPWIVAATSLWTAIIVYTLLVLLPINNHIAALKINALPAGWLQQHRKWDAHHRVRILLLIVAVVLLTYGIV